MSLSQNFSVTAISIVAVSTSELSFPDHQSCCDVQVRYTAKQLSADMSHGATAQTDRVDADWVAPDWFSRSTTKYWVQPQDRMRVKCEIIKNLPVSIYGGQRHKLAAGECLLPASLCLKALRIALFVWLRNQVIWG